MRRNVSVDGHGLGAMADMRDGEVKGHHGPRVTEDQELTPVEDALLLDGQVGDAKETGSFADLLGNAAVVDGPAGIKEEADREPSHAMSRYRVPRSEA